MNKKTLLVIIIAGILALIGAFAILKMTQKSEIITPVQQQEEEIIPIPEPEPVKVEEVKPEQKPAATNPVKKVSYKKPIPQKPAVKELPEIKPIVVKEAETPAHENVVQEEDSKDIVITKEYKIQTPARYTFK